VSIFFHHVDIVVSDTTCDHSFLSHFEGRLSHNKYLGTGVFDMVHELIKNIAWVCKLIYPVISTWLHTIQPRSTLTEIQRVAACAASTNTEYRSILGENAIMISSCASFAQLTRP